MEHRNVKKSTISVKYSYRNTPFGITDIRYYKWPKAGGGSAPIIEEKYFNKLIRILTETSDHKEVYDILNHLKKSPKVARILPDLNHFISLELKEAKQFKVALILQILHCLYLNPVAAEKGLCIYTYSLESFLTDSLQLSDFHCLSKDIAADILSQFCDTISINELKEVTILQLSRVLQDTSNCLENLYGAVVGCLPNMTPKAEVDVVHSNAFRDDAFTTKVLNSYKFFYKFFLLCKPFIYCCLPSKIADMPLPENNSFYDFNLRNADLYNLMRNEAMHTPISFVKYESKESTTLLFSDLLFDEEKFRNLHINGASNDNLMNDNNSETESHIFLNQQNVMSENVHECLLSSNEDDGDFGDNKLFDTDLHHDCESPIMDSSDYLSEEGVRCEKHCSETSQFYQIPSCIGSSQLDLDPFNKLENNIFLNWEYKRPPKSKKENSAVQETQKTKIQPQKKPKTKGKKKISSPS